MVAPNPPDPEARVSLAGYVSEQSHIKKANWHADSARGVLRQSGPEPSDAVR